MKMKVMAGTFSTLIMIVCFTVGGCGGAESLQEEKITYEAWLDGCWESTEVVAYCRNRVSLGKEAADSLIGTKYDFSTSWEGNVVGGAVPIRDVDTQQFFFVEFPYTLAELGVGGSYYLIVHIDKEGLDGNHPCIIIKDRNEFLLTENCTGVYNIQRVESTGEMRQNMYEKELTFEENIRKRMEIQGIKYEPYYRDAWGGSWVIQEVVSTDDMREARKHIGEVVTYTEKVDYLDIQFITSEQDRIFYDMPTTGELGLEGDFYLLVLDSDHEYPAAILKSEHEIFFICGNTVYRAIQEQTYLDEIFLQGA